MIKFDPKKSLSHAIMVVCVIISTIGFLWPTFASEYSFHSKALSSGLFPVIQQTALFQFLHADIFHLFMNMYFLLIAGPEVEARMTRDKFILFFLTSTIFTAFGLYFFSTGTTIGMSGFCMALLSYLAIDLYSTKHHSFQNIALLLAANIFIGLLPGISFVGHLFWAIWWVIWWFILSKNSRLFK